MPSYDANGNLTSDGTFTYGYDAESRLVSASGAGTSATYAYDALGQRKSKTVNGTTTLFVQDPEGRALLDYAGSGGAVGASLQEAVDQSSSSVSGSPPSQDRYLFCAYIRRDL